MVPARRGWSGWSKRATGEDPERPWPSEPRSIPTGRAAPPATRVRLPHSGVVGQLGGPRAVPLQLRVAEHLVVEADGGTLPEASNSRHQARDEVALQSGHGCGSFDAYQ